MSDDAKSDLPPLATDAEMDAWVAAGRQENGLLEVLWHAHHARRRCWTEADCPFGAEAPVARGRWLNHFRLCVRAQDQRRQEELADAEDSAPDKKGQWWMKY